ncbi:unnamed protein product, partial [Ectocarpus fasciculatus]
LAGLCGFVRPRRGVRSHPGGLPGREAARPPPPRGVLHAVRAERGGAEVSDVTGQGDEG